MKGYIDAKGYDRPPCGSCKHKKRLTVEAPCCNCISLLDIALHKPNSETEFASYEPQIEYGPQAESEGVKVEVGKHYKPSLTSFEDFCIVEVYQIGMGRVLYTDIVTQENGECDSGTFEYYYEPATEEEVNRAKVRSKK